MIIDTSQGDIEVIGDIKEFKTSIDPKNLEFITTLLSSNLYSDPEQSFIREIVSNAWDSHVEAGNTDTPVIIKFGSNLSSRSITIRDYGTGLSPERFAEVYCNIGSSTKRESNNFIGGFGIGKYSSLACSNTVYITSYYNNMAYYYVMVKSGNAITTNLLREQPTNEKNGVEITIKGITSLTAYTNALDCIVFFPNVYVDGINHSLNSTKIKRFEHFAVSSQITNLRLLLGNVLYPCNGSLLPSDVSTFLNDLRYTGIVIKFEIGELGITPNRENIIYTSDTIDKISDRVRAAKKELYSMISKKLCNDYQDIEEYCKCFNKTLYYNPLKDTINSNYEGYRVIREEIDTSHITFKGIDLSDELVYISTIRNTILPNFKAVIYNDKLYSNKLIWNIRNWDTIASKKILICKNCSRLTAAIKSYVREKFNNYTIVGDITEGIVKAHIENNVKYYATNSTSKHKDLVIKGVYDAIMSKSTTIDFNTDADFATYKVELASMKVPAKIAQKRTILYEIKGYRQTREFSRFSDALNYIKSLKKGIIIANMDEDEEFWSSVARIKDYAFFKANKETVSQIRELNLKCIVDMGWLLREDPLIDRVHTAMECFPSGYIEDLSGLQYTVNEQLYNEFHAICKLLDYSNCYKRHCKAVGKIDSYTKYICDKIKDYHTKWQEARQTVGNSCDRNLTNILSAAVVVKTGSYRINYRAYRDIKNNKLLKVLCRK